MAVLIDLEAPLRRGKMNKKSDVVYRVRNGKQQSYIPTPNTNPPTRAQSAHRAHFGKVNALVNAIMADPAQQAEWEQKRLSYNASLSSAEEKRYKTLRSFVFASISAQLAQKETARRRRNPIKKALPRGLKLRVRHFSELTTTDLYEILKARFAVFYTEQGCRYQDMDGVDYSCTHLALHRKGSVIAYARLFRGAEPGVWHIGRMLTTERGCGWGRYIMEQTEAEARRQGAQSLLIHAQTHAEAFYKKLGFKPEGEIFMEADIPHIQMTKELV